MGHPSYQPITNTTTCRLRTKRQRRRALLEDRDKQLLKLDREHARLWEQRNNLPWIPLEPPVIRGWKRSFVLRDDVARHKDAPMYERILKCINEVQYSHRRDFKKKKRSRGRKIHVVRDQQLKRLDSWEWNKCAFTPEEAAHFELVEKVSYPCGAVTYRYVFRESWRFVLRIQPNIISRTRQYDANLEAEIKAIDNYLDRTQQRNRLNKLLHGRSWNWKSRRSDDLHYTSRHPFQNIPLHNLLTED